MASDTPAATDLNITPDHTVVVRTPEDNANFLYVETKGPFQEQAPKAWGAFWAAAGPGTDAATHRDIMGCSNVDPSVEGDDKFTYRAAMTVSELPDPIPEGLSVGTGPVGKYVSWTLTGPYGQLATAYPWCMEQLKATEYTMRNDFCVEIYLNKMGSVPDEELQTVILLPVEE